MVASVPRRDSSGRVLVLMVLVVYVLLINYL